MKNTRAPLQKAKVATPDRPTEVRTDGPHKGLGKTPAEAAGFLPMDGLRWLEILERAVTRKGTTEEMKA